MSTTHALLIGARHPHSRLHLRSLQMLDEVQDIQVWDSEPSAAAQLAAEHGDQTTRPVEDLDSALADSALGWCLVAVPTDISPELALHCLRHDKHVIAEKPMARSARELAPVRACAQERNLTLSVCYPYRCYPHVIEMRRLVAGGALGRLTSFELRMVTSQVKFRDPGHWLFSRQASGGGVLSWLACHLLDMLRFVTADEVRYVSALTATLSGEPIDVEDSAAVALQMHGGAVGSLCAAYALPRSRAGYEGAAFDVRLSLRGTQGWVDSRPMGDAPTLRFESVAPEFATHQPRETSYNLPRVDAYGGMAGLEFTRQFIRACAGDGPPPTDASDAVAVLRILDATYRSSWTGHRATILL